MYLDLFDLEARPGDEILPAWEEMQKAVLALRLRQGPGILLTETEAGTVVSAEGVESDFPHPFTPALSGSGLTLTKGLVNGTEPVINGTPVSGDAARGSEPPVLPLDGAEVDPSTLTSWVCVEVTPKADGTLDAAQPPVIVHRSSPVLDNPATGRHALALILWQDGAPARVFEITYFNLQYTRTTPAPGEGAARHFFL